MQMFSQRACNQKQITSLDGTDQLADELDEPALTSLPDVPLLGVLSHLPAADLGAVGRVCTRLRALTRSHRSLWRGKRARLQDPGALVDLLRAAPPWDTLELRVAHARVNPRSARRGPASAPEEGRGGQGDAQGTRTPPVDKIQNFLLIDFLSSKKLVVSVVCYAPCPSKSGDEDKSGLHAVRIIRLLGPRTRHLIIDNCSAAVFPLLDGLRTAKSLQTLCLKSDWMSEIQPPPSLDEWWPQSSPLPKLCSVELDVASCPFCSPAWPGASAFNISCLRVLLEAHRRQLRCVSLRLAALLPLLELCPGALPRLTAPAGPGLAAGLRHLRDLRKLKIVRTTVELESEVDALLASWPGPLQALQLPLCTERTVRAVGAGALTSLSHLHLDLAEAGALRVLPAALRALPRLRSLVLRTAPPPDVLRDISAAALPALCLLTILCDPCPANNLYSRRAALRELVVRSATQLHVVRPALTPSPGLPAAKQVYLFASHSAADCESCRLCTEARETAALTSPVKLPIYVCLATDGARA
ncbi:hypothetical protein FOCC_FOCC011332 [Frankliniella occidentalis]|uniref:Uncharacterized protein LOC113212501 isoform X2 n=1 Tax=Frankliniella occidentalis TaxID=133901 RepID=A0A6J1T198_FRAOC|nr:uncharacterized protein LOC113212501 isoform X2 [Frankliniella occidentalis]KAE8743086.1 hypothetical protein FOCC_FOCC011332 [Frankliniella occidentalis]